MMFPLMKCYLLSFNYTLVYTRVERHFQVLALMMNDAFRNNTEDRKCEIVYYDDGDKSL